MGEVVLSLPQLNSVCLDLPYVLFKLAEQITPDQQETMIMSVTSSHGTSVKITMEKTMQGEEERLMMAIIDSNNEDIIKSDGENWRIELGSVQSPVYLQNSTKTNSETDRKTTPSTRSPVKLSSPESIRPATAGVSLTSEEIDDAHLQNIHQENSNINSSQLPGMSQPDESTVISQDGKPNITQQMIYNGQQVKVMDNHTDNVNEVNNETLTEIIVSGESATPQDLLESGILENLLKGQDFTVIAQSETDTFQLVPNLNSTPSDQSSGQHLTQMEQNSLQLSDSLIVENDSLCQNPSASKDRHCELVGIKDESTSLTDCIQSNKANDKPEEEQSSVIVLESQQFDSDNGLESFVVLSEPMEIEEEQYNVTELLPSTDWWQSQPERKSSNDITVKTEETEDNNDEETSDIQTEDVPSSQHQIQNTSDIPRIVVDITAYRCSVCKKIFNTKQLLSGHYRVKHNESDYDDSAIERVLMKDMFLCFICQQPFRRYHSVLRHVQSIHKIEVEKRKINRVVTCQICGSKHSSHHTLRCHLNYKHTDHPDLKQHLVDLQTQIFSHKTSVKPTSILLQCPWCDLHLNQTHFRFHVKSAHSGEESLQQVLDEATAVMRQMKHERKLQRTKVCPICKVELPVTRYYTHIRRVHQVATKPMNSKCSECGKVLGSSWHLKLHMAVHADSRDYECEECGHKFRNKYALQGHIKVIHQGVYRCRCDVCKRGFHSQKALANHRCVKLKNEGINRHSIMKVISDAHEEDGSGRVQVQEGSDMDDMEKKPEVANISQEEPIPQIAAICSKDISHTDVHPTATEAKTDLSKSGPHCKQVMDKEEHSKTVHKNCDNSMEQVTSEADDNQSPPESPVKDSSIMDDEAESYPTQKDQIETTEWGSFVCKICRKEFTARMGICAHLRRVHRISNKPIKQFECDVCGRQFILQSKLRTHQQTHQDNKEICSLCGNTYTTKYGLLRHIKVVHEGEYSFHCDQCGRGFQKRTYLRSHDCGRPARRNYDLLTIKQEPQTIHNSDDECNVDKDSNDTQNIIDTHEAMRGSKSCENIELENHSIDINLPNNNIQNVNLGSKESGVHINTIINRAKDTHGICKAPSNVNIKRVTEHHQTDLVSNITVMPCVKKNVTETTVVLVTRSKSGSRVQPDDQSANNIANSQDRHSRRENPNNASDETHSDRQQPGYTSLNAEKSIVKVFPQKNIQVKNLVNKKDLTVLDNSPRNKSTRVKTKPVWLLNYDR